MQNLVKPHTHFYCTCLLRTDFYLKDRNFDSNVCDFVEHSSKLQLVSNMQLIYHGDRCHASRIRNLHLGFKSCWHFTTTFIRATFPANFSRFIIEFVRFLHRRIRTDQNPGKIKKIKKRKNLKICETFFNKLGKCLSRTSKVRIY